MRILGQFAIFSDNQTAAAFRNRLLTSAEEISTPLSKTFIPPNCLNAVTAYISGKHGYFSEGIYYQTREKYLSLVGIYLLIPRSR